MPNLYFTLSKCTKSTFDQHKSYSWHKYCLYRPLSCRFAMMSSYINGSMLPSLFCHVLLSLSQFPLAQSTLEYCQSKMFLVFCTLLPLMTSVIKWPSILLSHHCPIMCLKQRIFPAHVCSNSIFLPAHKPARW